MMRNGVLFTNSSYRTSTGIRDSRVATRELKELVDAGVVEQTGTRGSAAYRLTATVHAATGQGGPVEAGALSADERLVLEVLAEGALLRAEIEERAVLSKDDVQYALAMLRQKGLVSMLGKPRSRSARRAAD